MGIFSHVLSTLFFLTLLLFLSQGAHAQDPSDTDPSASSATYLPQSIYNLEDLKVLESQKSFREFLKHAHDVRPSERGKIWQQMVAHMAEKYIRDLIKRKDINRQHFLYLEEIANWPILKSDEFYQLKREQYAINYFEICIPRPADKNCQNDLKNFWKDSRKNPEVGIKLATMLNGQGVAPSQLWEYYQFAAKSSLSEFYCRQSIMQKTVWIKLQDIFELKLEAWSSRPKEFQQAFSQIIHQDCWKQLAPTLKNGMLFSSDSHRRKSLSHMQIMLAYELLKLHDNLSQPEEDLFLALFLLNGPIVGKTFNLAWARLKLISQDYKRRQQLLKNIKKLDPLPDGLFGSADNDKKEVLVDFVSKHFPEYLDYYSKTCLAYLEGSKTFSHGNPTINCKDFFSLTSKQNWVSQSLKIRYSGLQKKLKGENSTPEKP